MDLNDIAHEIVSLRTKTLLSDIEYDILDTWEELLRNPFERGKAQLRIATNNMKHPDIQIAIATEPNTVIRPFTEVTEEDLKHNLKKQLEYLLIKAGLVTKQQC